MVDDGKLDWKIIALNKEDRNFNLVNSLEDLDKYFPNYISGIREWFRWYKYPDNKKSSFLYDGKLLDKNKSIEIIESLHNYWKKLKEYSYKCNIWIE